MIGEDVKRVTDRSWPTSVPHLLGTAPGAPDRGRAVTHADVALAGSSMPIDLLVRITGLAVQAPIVLATLVHDAAQQVLLGAHGLDWTPTDRIGPLQFSLCGQVITTGLPIIVNDAASDPRVLPGPGVRDAEVAGYAGFPLHGDDGQVVGTVCVVDRQSRQWSTRELAIVDQTAQMIANALADESARLAAHARRDAEAGQAFLNALLDSLDTGVAACDAAGKLVLVNRSFREASGFDPEGIEPADWQRHFQIRRPDGAAMSVEEMPLWRAMHGEQARGVEQLLGPSRRQVQVNGHPIIGQDGQRLGAVAAVHDVTARRQAERLHACELEISYALADAADTGTAGRAVLRIVGEAFGWASGELWLVDEHTDDLCRAVHWDRRPGASQRVIGATGLAGTARRAGVPVWHPDAASVAAALTAGTGPAGAALAPPAQDVQAALALPLRSGERTVGVLAFYADTPHEPDDPVVRLLSGVAAHLAQYLERRRAEDLELALARSKDEYIALVGHELRTPLTSIASYTELIDGHPAGTDIEDVRPLIQVLLRNTAALRCTIDDLLDLAAIDAGHVTLHPQAVDLTRLLHDATAAVTTAAAAAGITVETDIADGATVAADPHRLRQVVDNLLSNAVKYSPDGGRITVTARLVPADPHPGPDTRDSITVVVTITDSGIGIPDGEQDRLFGRFYRTSLARQHGIPGTGLGLAISRTIAERHHGTLHLHNNTPGPGATATLRLPAADVPQPRVP